MYTGYKDCAREVLSEAHIKGNDQIASAHGGNRDLTFITHSAGILAATQLGTQGTVPSGESVGPCRSLFNMRCTSLQRLWNCFSGIVGSLHDSIFREQRISV